MNKLTAFLLIVIMALCFIVGTTMQSKAQGKTFSGIIPFVTGSDRVGFFDQNNGMVYIYDNNLSQCVFVGQIQTLGKTIKSDTGNSGPNTLYGNQ